MYGSDKGSRSFDAEERMRQGQKLVDALIDGPPLREEAKDDEAPCNRSETTSGGVRRRKDGVLGGARLTCTGPDGHVEEFLNATIGSKLLL